MLQLRLSTWFKVISVVAMSIIFIVGTNLSNPNPTELPTELPTEASNIYQEPQLSLNREIVTFYCKNKDQFGWNEHYANITTVLNRCEPDDELTNPSIKAVKQIDDVGKDVYAVLWYIIEFYDSLPDVILFIPSNSISATQQNIESLFKEASLYGISRNTFNEFYPLPSDDYEIKHPQDNPIPERKDKEQYDSRIKTIGEMWKVLFNGWQPFPIKFMDTCFAVRNDFVYSREKQYYSDLIQHVNWHKNPDEAWFIDSSWYYIFQPWLVVENYDLMVNITDITEKVGNDTNVIGDFTEMVGIIKLE